MKKQSLTLLLLWICLEAVLFTACRTNQQAESELNRHDSPEVEQSATSIKYAKGFRLEAMEGYKVVTILAATQAEPTATYVLLPKGTTLPATAPKGTVIEVPVQQMVAMSSLHVGMLELLEATQTLVGVDQLAYIYSAQVHQLAQQGKVVQVGQNMDPDLEKIIDLKPDLVMGTGNSGPSPLQKVQDAGIPVVLNSEWMEETPLAKAEWIKLMAALVGKEQEAQQLFETIEAEYNRLVKLASSAPVKPVIVTGMNLKDVWYMPNRDNYMTQFLLDAGADYPLKDRKGRGSSALSFEAVYPMALQATIWLNLGTVGIQTKQELVALDSRYADFTAFRNGQIYDYSNRVNAEGANDFWESAGVRPDQVLADLVKILHPELLPEHQLYYYRRLE